MEALASIFDWLREQEAGFSALAAIAVLAGILFTGIRFLLRRGGETAREEAPARSAGPTSSADSSSPDLDPLTVPGFEGRPAIAVLPFDNLSGDPEQEYFADGIAEDLITRLSHEKSFPVIARNSSFTYKGKPVDVKQVSRELGARYIVEGSVRRVGDRVRITAQLIDASSGAHIWAEQYDRELRDILPLQDEITLAIVGSVYPGVARVEQERVVRLDPQSLDAWECTLRGWWHMFRSSELGREDNFVARRSFERAIELDPHSSEAYAGLAITHYSDLQHHWATDPDESTAFLHRMARQAVVLDPRNVAAQCTLAFAHGQEGRQDEMVRALERAIELSPSSSMAHGNLGVALALGGRSEEGIANLEKAMRLDPKSPSLSFWLAAVAWSHFVAERYEEAVRWAKRSSGENPDFAYAYRVLAASYGQLGRLDDARRALEEDLQREPEISISKVMSEPWNPFADPDFLERYADGLRKAGLKE